MPRELVKLHILACADVKKVTLTTMGGCHPVAWGPVESKKAEQSRVCSLCLSSDILLLPLDNSVPGSLPFRFRLGLNATGPPSDFRAFGPRLASLVPLTLRLSDLNYFLGSPAFRQQTVGLLTSISVKSVPMNKFPVRLSLFVLLVLFLWRALTNTTGLISVFLPSYQF